MEAPGGVQGSFFCWVCAAGLSEPLTYFSLCCGPIKDPNFVRFWERPEWNENRLLNIKYGDTSFFYHESSCLWILAPKISKMCYLVTLLKIAENAKRYRSDYGPALGYDQQKPIMLYFYHQNSHVCIEKQPNDVCAAGLSEPLTYFSLCCGQLKTPSLSAFGQDRNGTRTVY